MVGETIGSLTCAQPSGTEFCLRLGGRGLETWVRLIRDWSTGRVGERTRLVGHGLQHLLEEAGGLRREEAKRPFARVDFCCCKGGKKNHAAKLPGTQAHRHAAKQGTTSALNRPNREAGRLNWL